MTELTEKQKWFFAEYAVDLNPVRAAKKIGMPRYEFETLINDPAYVEHLREATRAYRSAKARENGEEKPPPSASQIDPTSVTRESVNAEIVQVMEDLKHEAISPGQATAQINAIKALAQVNGLITTEIIVGKKEKPPTEWSTQELLDALNQKDGKMIDVVPATDEKTG